MNLQVEILETHEARMTIGVDASDVEKARRDVAREMSKQVRIPGFRPGHAPTAAVVRAMGGEEAFMAEVTNKLANDLYPAALDEAKIEPYGPGRIDDLKAEPFALIAVVPLEPVIDLKEYKSIRLPAPEVSIDEAELQEQLSYIREENAIVTEAERPVEMGDLIEGTIVGMSGDEEVLRSQSRRGMVVDAKRMNVPGLAEAIVGMSAGEHKDVQVTFPEDHETEALRSKVVDVHIEVTRVSGRVLPELNDELAQAASAFSTIAEMIEDVRKQMLSYKQRQADSDYSLLVLDAFADLADVKAPPAFFEDRLSDLLQDFKEDVKRDSGLPWEEYLAMQNKDEAAVREELRPQAERRGKRGLVMREIGRAEALVVSEDEVAQEVESTAVRYGSRQSEVRKLLADRNTRDSVRNNLMSGKVMSCMVAIAKGEAAQVQA
ncbi:MAG: trigger factor [Chloroflexi bacterium]|nr:trigger factor [Chloroflexota bacterium]